MGPARANKRGGFTLLEVMIAVALVGGILVSFIYSINYHLGIAARHEVTTVAVMLGSDLISSLDKNATDAEGAFPAPYSDYKYVVKVKDSAFPGFPQISVTVTHDKEVVVLKELIRR